MVPGLAPVEGRRGIMPYMESDHEARMLDLGIMLELARSYPTVERMYRQAVMVSAVMQTLDEDDLRIDAVFHLEADAGEIE